MSLQLWGQSFAGTVTRVAMTFPSRRKPTGGVVGLFFLELLPRGPMPPLRVLPMPLTDPAGVSMPLSTD